MPDPVIRARRAAIAPDVEFGEDVVIEADEVEIGPGARIGISDDDDFRTPPGVRIRVRSLVLGAGVAIGRAVRIDGGEIRLGAGTRVRRHATVRVLDRLEIGIGGAVGEGCEIAGRNVHIGQELWMLPGAKIGGGSAFERRSQLNAGHFLHLGVDTLINTARPVRIGHEVGLGTRTCIYTHGAYPSRLMGFPVAFEGVEIGDFSWIPGAIINPGVHIGRNCVIGVNSLVTADIPDGSLAVGSPARVIREQAFPRPLSTDEVLEFFDGFLRAYADLLGLDATPTRLDGFVSLETDAALYLAGSAARAGLRGTEGGGRRVLIVADLDDRSAPDGWSVFDTATRRVRGVADAAADRLANELRRYGIRFYSRGIDGKYVDWDVDVPRFEGLATPVEATA
jgi:acetyltransferase-like isoleucine patch superfamily enzyme